jgi:hypothetical protein
MFLIETDGAATISKEKKRKKKEIMKYVQKRISL